MRRAAPWLDSVPPLFANCTASISEDDERALLNAYHAATGPGSDDELHVARLEEAIRRVPFVAEPFVYIAIANLTSGDLDAARGHAAAALALLSSTGIVWDKRLSLEGWRDLAEFVAHAVDRPALHRSFDAARLERILRSVGRRPDLLHARLTAVNVLADKSAERRIVPRVTAVTSGRSTAATPLPERFARYVSQPNPEGDLRMRTYPGLTSMPWHDPSSFPIVCELERMSALIREELHDLDTHTFHREVEPIDRTGSWDVCMLFERGKRRNENCELLPITTRIIETHRTLRTHAGIAYFSRLSPKTRVASHRGPTNMRLRCHLGIDVPPDCGVTVAGESRSWSEGRCIVFDDSFEHSVWNDSDRPRIVLIVDLWHPDLSDEEIVLLERMHLYAAAYAQDLNAYWSLNDSARLRSGAD